MACSCKKNKPVQQEVKPPVSVNLSDVVKPKIVTLSNLTTQK